MSNIPTDLRYASTHEWVRPDGDGVFTIGISDHAQELLGDMVFVELPEVGTEVGAGDDIAVTESVKAASDVYAPISGEIVEVNALLDDTPELVNSDAFGEGWLIKIKAKDITEVEGLLDSQGYEGKIEDE